MKLLSAPGALVFMLDNEQLEIIMHALTLRDRGDDKRTVWMNGGFRRIHRRAGALLEYWKERVSRDPESANLAEQIWQEYEAAPKNEPKGEMPPP